MPDRRKHRGPHPADGRLFAVEFEPPLRRAVADLSWLWTQGYSHAAALKIVGDRFQLTARQRLAVARSACSDQSLANRHAKHCSVGELAGAEIHIDGFNLLTTIEAALAGGVLLIGRDGCLRDMAGMHGSYRKVEETTPAIEMIGRNLDELQVTRALWLFDKPVSNSGRISQLVLKLGESLECVWDAELPPDPDRELINSTATIVSADAVVIDGCRRWCNLAEWIVRASETRSRIVDLRTGSLATNA